MSRPRRPTPLLILAGAVGLALVILLAALVAAQAIQGTAAANRPINGAAPACPTVAPEGRS